jgi:hypothetical protein
LEEAREIMERSLGREGTVRVLGRGVVGEILVVVPMAVEEAWSRTAGCREKVEVKASERVARLDSGRSVREARIRWQTYGSSNFGTT